MRILILEDDPNRVHTFMTKLGMQHELVCVNTAAAAIDMLHDADVDSSIDLVFLEHDLGGEVYVDTKNKNTGSEVVRWLTRQSLNVPCPIILHSLNEPASRSMQLSLLDRGFEVHRIPFTQLVDHLDDPSFITTN
jgi:hypothetical protein